MEENNQFTISDSVISSHQQQLQNAYNAKEQAQESLDKSTKLQHSIGLSATDNKVIMNSKLADNDEFLGNISNVVMSFPENDQKNYTNYLENFSSGLSGLDQNEATVAAALKVMSENPNYSDELAYALTGDQSFVNSSSNKDASQYINDGLLSGAEINKAGNFNGIKDSISSNVDRDDISNKLNSPIDRSEQIKKPNFSEQLNNSREEFNNSRNESIRQMDFKINTSAESGSNLVENEYNLKNKSNLILHDNIFNSTADDEISSLNHDKDNLLGRTSTYGINTFNDNEINPLNNPFSYVVNPNSVEYKIPQSPYFKQDSLIDLPSVDNYSLSDNIINYGHFNTNLNNFERNKRENEYSYSVTPDGDKIPPNKDNK